MSKDMFKNFNKALRMEAMKNLTRKEINERLDEIVSLMKECRATLAIEEFRNLAIEKRELLKLLEGGNIRE